MSTLITVQLFTVESAITLLFKHRNTGNLKKNCQQIVGKPDDKNSLVPHTFSFLASQRKACNILEIKSYYSIIVDDKSIIVGPHSAGQPPHVPLSKGCVMQ